MRSSCAARRRASPGHFVMMCMVWWRMTGHTFQSEGRDSTDLLDVDFVDDQEIQTEILSPSKITIQAFCTHTDGVLVGVDNLNSKLVRIPKDRVDALSWLHENDRRIGRGEVEASYGVLLGIGCT